MATTIPNAGIKIPASATAHISMPDGVLKPIMWSAAAADVFPASKMQVPKHIGTNFGLAITGTPVARVEMVYVAGAAGTINKFAAVLNDSGTTTDCDFVLLKNGSALMSGDLTIVHGTGDRIVVEGTLSDVAYVAGDVFSIQIIVNASTGAQGPYAWFEPLEVLS